jgi:hypothetical protein
MHLCQKILNIFLKQLMEPRLSKPVINFASAAPDKTAAAAQDAAAAQGAAADRVQDTAAYLLRQISSCISLALLNSCWSRFLKKVANT